ncbi:ArsR/SmtB family transcription factor [Rothia nasimurium]|uniref:ArsR/SmtB family transcription factor n=1 Tax=Rothia nasimurium TaxID=85336 RepID=UPI003615E3BA
MKDDVFAVIADPTRRHILQALAVERLAVGELVEELGVSQPTVSKHLKVLRTAGLVETEAVGQKRFYSITPTPLTAVKAWAEGLLAAPALEEMQAEEAEENSTAAQSAPEQQGEASAPAVDVPHPNTAGITFTPLTPFTPVLDNRVDEEAVENQAPANVEQDAVSDQVRQLAQSLSLGTKDEEPISFKVPTPEQVIAQEVAAKASDEQAHKQAHKQAGGEEGDDRGLLAKLTRWGRRSSR